MIPCPDVPSLPHSQQAQYSESSLVGDTISIAFPDPVLISLKEVYKKSSKAVFKGPIREKKSVVVVNSIDLLENVPPRTENEVRLQGVPHDSGRARPLCCYYELQAWKPALSWDIFLSVTRSISDISNM